MNERKRRKKAMSSTIKGKQIAKTCKIMRWGMTKRRQSEPFGRAFPLINAVSS